MCPTEASAASGVYAGLGLASKDCCNSGNSCLERRERVRFVRGGGLFNLRLLLVSVIGLLPFSRVSSTLRGACVHVLAGICASMSVVRVAAIGDSAASGTGVAACRSCKG